MAESEQLNQYLLQQQKQTHDETRKVLDYLRQTRKSRGGTGAPLQVPGNLRIAAEGKPEIVITDAELSKDGSAESAERSK